MANDESVLREFMMENQLPVAGCCCGFSFTWFILFLCSFKGLHATEYGLLENGLSGVVDYSHVYQSTKETVGFWKSFIVFPGNVQSIEWINLKGDDGGAPINVRSREGIQVQIGLILQYQIVKAKVPEIYRLFKDRYTEFFVSLLRARFQLCIADFTVEELWTKRLPIKNYLLGNCTEVAATDLMGMITCWDIQFLDIHFAKELEDKVEARQVEQQTQAAERQKQVSKLIRVNTEVLESDYDRKIIELRASAEAEAYISKHNASTNADYNTEEAWSTVLDLASTQLGLTAKQTNKFYENGCYADAKTANLVYGSFTGAVKVVTNFEDKHENYDETYGGGVAKEALTTTTTTKYKSAAHRPACVMGLFAALMWMMLQLAAP